MNNIEKVYNESKNISDFSKGYFDYLKSVLDSMDLECLDKLAVEFEDAREKGNTIFVAGNGGSAATATTMANDIGFDIIKKTETDKPFKVFSLTDNTSVITAISNDVGYENIFINQLKIHYSPGDKLLVISASGNSENVVKAANWVKKRGGRIIGFLGFNGGNLIDLCDLTIHVKTEFGEYGPVEDTHLILNHVLAHWFQNKLK
jgi:D-sedoheptulose 7-phosphate isomerase